MHFTTYSTVPNRRAVPNKRAGGKILKKTLNVQGRIDVQGGKSTQKILNVQDVINVQGEIFVLIPLKKCVLIPLNKKKRVYFEKDCTFMTI